MGSIRDNLAVRQCLLELPDALLSDLGIFEVQRFELGQLFEMLQPGIRDPLGEEVQLSKLRQVFDAFQGSVGLYLGLDHVGAEVIANPVSQPCWAGWRWASGSGLPDWSISKSNLTPPPVARIASTASCCRIDLCSLLARQLMAIPATSTSTSSVIRLYRSQRRRGLGVSVMRVSIAEGILHVAEMNVLC